MATRAGTSETPGDEELVDAIAALTTRTFGARPLRIDPIPAGLGRRRFFRVRLPSPPRALVARYEPAPDGLPLPYGIAPEPPLAPILEFLESRGLPVPRCHADWEIHDGARLTLLEDLGDESLERRAREGIDRRGPGYAAACRIIPQLQALQAPATPLAAFRRRLDAPLIETKALKLLDWFLPRALERSPHASERETVLAAFGRIADECRGAPQRLSHRDFKAANLLLRPAPEPGGAEEIVMIDVQGAFLAPPEYDLVCLLRDSHVALSESEIQALLGSTRVLLPDTPDEEVLQRRFTLLTISRVAKDIAHYTYAAAGGDASHLPYVPAGLRNLRAAARRAASWTPELERFADLIDTIAAREEPGGGSS